MIRIIKIMYDIIRGQFAAKMTKTTSVLFIFNGCKTIL